MSHQIMEQSQAPISFQDCTNMNRGGIAFIVWDKEDRSTTNVTIRVLSTKLP